MRLEKGQYRLHKRRTVIRTISEFLLFGIFAALCSLATAAPGTIRQPRLTQDLLHTPRLNECMRELVRDQLSELVNLRGFAGPFSVGPKDLAGYQLLGNPPSTSKLRLVFRALDKPWRFFPYGGDMNDPLGHPYIGMGSPLMSAEAAIWDETDHAIETLDLEPCRRFLGY